MSSGPCIERTFPGKLFRRNLSGNHRRAFAQLQNLAGEFFHHIQRRWFRAENSPELFHFDALHRARDRGENHHFDVRQYGFLANGGQHFRAAVPGKMQVEQNHARLGLPCAAAVGLYVFESCFAIRRTPPSGKAR